jgi:hypothetical protein
MFYVDGKNGLIVICKDKRNDGTPLNNRRNGVEIFDVISLPYYLHMKILI